MCVFLGIGKTKKIWHKPKSFTTSGKLKETAISIFTMQYTKYLQCNFRHFVFLNGSKRLWKKIVINMSQSLSPISTHAASSELAGALFQLSKKSNHLLRLYMMLQFYVLQVLIFEPKFQAAFSFRFVFVQYTECILQVHVKQIIFEK